MNSSSRKDKGKEDGADSSSLPLPREIVRADKKVRCMLDASEASSHNEKQQRAGGVELERGGVTSDAHAKRRSLIEILESGVGSRDGTKSEGNQVDFNKPDSERVPCSDSPSKVKASTAEAEADILHPQLMAADAKIRNNNLVAAALGDGGQSWHKTELKTILRYAVSSSHPNPAPGSRINNGQDAAAAEEVESPTTSLPPISRPGAFPQAGVDRRESEVSTSMFTHYNTSQALAENKDAPNPRASADPDTTDNYGLVQASVVTLSEQIEVQDLEVAEPFEEEETQPIGGMGKTRTNFLWLAIGVGLFVIALVVSLLAATLVTKPNKQQYADAATHSNATTAAPSMTPLLLTLLPLGTQSIVMEDTEGVEPQTKAYRWLLQDPKLGTYSNSRLQQRFALATFYYATGGPYWRNQGGQTVTITVQQSSVPPRPQGGGPPGGGPPGGGPPGGGPPGGGGGPPGAGSPGGGPPGGGPPQNWGPPPGGGPPAGGPPGGGPPGGGQPGGEGRPQGPTAGPPGAGGSMGGPGKGTMEITITREEWLDYHSHECLWYSTYVQANTICFPDNDTIKVLDLTGNGLSGSLPPEICLLSSLERLNVHNNKIGGLLPGFLPPNLLSVHIQTNEFRGPIPPEIGLLSSTLKHLAIQDNQFTGSFPEKFWKLSNLSDLGMGNNLITGTLPDNMGDLVPNLSKLLAPKNKISGPLPSSIWKCSRLRALQISDNQLTGSLPTELGLLTNMQMGLGVEENKITGTIPSELGRLANNLHRLAISDTLITGTIPPEVCGFGEKLVFDCSASLCGCSMCPCSNFTR